MGSSFKVPFLRHDFGQMHWESVGRIIAFGWQKEKYLPVKLAPVILEQATFGYAKSNVIENFLKFVPESERAVFEAWQSDFNTVDKEELLEVLDGHSCRKTPTENNAEEILQELAHKKLIQEPAYVIEQWANMLSTAINHLDDISSVYENLQPTVRKVLRALSFPENMNTQQREIQRYLTTYLRESGTRGWQKEKYLPVKLAPVILEQATFGYAKSNVIENFLKFVPESERAVFEAWQSDFNTVDKEELLEVLDGHSCRKTPTENNAEEILQELAHKKLIQEPAYVIEQWANMLSTAISHLDDISSVYENLQPTVRKVLRALSFRENMNTQQREIQRYLTTYLRESGTRGLSRFLRFCTGSDLFLGKTIVINFTQIQGFQRRPVAHTCGCVLELSVFYDSYPDFRSEINSLRMQCVGDGHYLINEVRKDYCL
ncbi:hypothetical protein DPX16_0357 [Anabarilius grahami]|uniref:HECT domain-containing protein n=1 Tax=Anabarilius grahami TaxID=495550 RepID=A0A3N0YZ69_ANAGA|nr:hypothetical protein DPX16_0357 [Anabarilius grahami]